MQIWDLNLRHLEAIARIADLGTMNAAARSVNLTQPAITQALARTEALVGAQLFERRYDGMVPTPAAQLLVPRIGAALDRIAGAHVPPAHMTMSRLRALLALADAGSYNAARGTTGLSLPSLHRAVGDLSLALRRRLAERRGKVVVLTEAGHALARALRLARLELEAGLAELEAMRGHETRSITVGAMPLSRARVLPAAIARFLRRHPQVRVSIVEGSRAELVEPLRNGMIDLMVGALRDPLLEPDLVQQPLFRSVPAVIARSGHPLAGGRPSLAQLAAYPWVVGPSGAPLRERWERVFAGAGLARPSVPVESGSAMIIRQLLLDSDFLSILAQDQVAVELEAGWLTTIGAAPPGLERMIGFTARVSWRPTAVQAAFVGVLETVATDVGFPA